MNDQEGEKRGNPCKGERRQLPRSKQQRRRLGTHIHDPGRGQEVGECGAEVQESCVDDRPQEKKPGRTGENLRPGSVHF